VKYEGYKITVDNLKHVSTPVYGSTGCCISQWPKVMRRVRFRLPYISVTIQPILMKFETHYYFSKTTHHAKCVDVGSLGEYPVCMHC